MGIIEGIVGLIKAIPIVDKWFERLFIWWASYKDASTDAEFSKKWNKIYLGVKNLRNAEELGKRREAFRDIVNSIYE